MKIKDGAKVFIKNERLGKYLFFLRDNKPTIVNPNMYGLLGGAIEEGELPIEALEREMEEESNIEISGIKELGSETVLHVIKDDQGVRNKEGKLFVFLAQTDMDLEDMRLFEGQRLEFFTIEEALDKENLAPPIRTSIIKYRELL